MKHTVKITISLLLLFFASQVIGLHIIGQRFDVLASSQTNTTIINQNDPVNQILGPPPEIGRTTKERISVVFQFLIAILIGTAIILLFAKFKLYQMWKLWFGFGVTIALFSALASYVKEILSIFKINELWLSASITIVIAIALTILKLYSKNIWTHNFTEIFIYGGIISILVSFFDMISVSLMLIVISIYDMIAVWKSKHMIKLAEFQTNAKVFGGLFLPYDKNHHIIGIKENKNQNINEKDKNKSRVAILGGGDIAFPLLFAGVLFMSSANATKALVIVIFSTISLGILFFSSKKGKFYPAMPFISIGCFIGLAFSYLV